MWGGGGGGGAVAFQTSPSAHNGGDAGGWGKGNQTGNGYGGNGGGIGSGGDSNLIITGGTPLEVGRYVYNGTSYDNAEALCNALKELSLPDTFNVDFYVEGESTPRTARVTANGKANNGQDIFIEHQYKAAFPTGNGGSQDVFFYKRDGITLPGEGGTVNIDGFDYENGWKIDGTFYSPGAKLSVASSGDVDLMSRAVQETSVFGFKSDSAGGYIMGFRNDALQANGNNNIVVSSDKQISSIELPSSPVNLDLSQATGFTNVNFGSSNKDRLAGITLPNTATAIADNAFQNCSSLSSINLPPSVTTIGNSAFYGCSTLQSFTMPNSVTSIGDSLFRGCSNLQSITLSNQLTEIPENTFRSCTNLCSALDIPAGVTAIGDYAFYECSSIPSLALPTSLQTIGYSAFVNCTTLQEVSIPNGVTLIDGAAFLGCADLAEISIPPSVSTIGAYAFSGVNNNCELILENNGSAITLLGPQALPTPDFKVHLTGTSVPKNADTGFSIFNENSNLTSVEIGKTIGEIPFSAFFGCDNLTTVTMETAGSIISKIGDEAFMNCANLSSINIPASITAIEGNAFRGVGEYVLGGGCTITFEDSQTMTQCSLPNQNYKVVLNRGVPKLGGGVLGDNGPSIFDNDTNLKEVVYAGGANLIANAFTGCSNLNTVTFQSYPTNIQNPAAPPTPPLPDNVSNIIFAPKNEMFIHDVSRLFSSGSVSVTFQFKNSADVGSVPPMITIRSDAFLSFGTSTSYQFDSEPDYYIYYESSSCFPAGSTGTKGGTNYTWNSGSWQ